MSKNSNKERDVAHLMELLPSHLNRIFLWGPMGSGKSSLAPLLAEALALPHWDLDDYIAQTQKKSIAALFKEVGARAFRQIEAAALHTLIRENPRMVLATGGGTPCFGNQAALMLNAGFCIYLQTPPEILAKRLLGQTRQRPLLKNLKDLTSLIAFFEQHLSEREPHYLQANLVYSGSG